MTNTQQIYLDHAASTPVASEVLRAMEPYFTEKYGNPGSLHSFGQEAIAAVDKSRETIAKAIGVDFREIIFTASATEANNLVLRGVFKSVKGQWSNVKSPRLIVSAVEHESILETARDLAQWGIEVVYLPVDKCGIVDLKKLKSSLNDRTALVSVMYANNEIGTVQPIAEIADIIRNFRSSKLEARNPKQVSKFEIRNSDFETAYPLFHVDAAQALQFLDCDADRLGVDLMTLSAHKIYGPKGIGALYVRNNESRIKNNGNANSVIHHSSFNIQPQITGGGQEFGMRSGTENVPSIVGFAKAVELAASAREKEAERIAKLRDYFWTELKKIDPKAELNGQPPSTNYESDANIRIRTFVKNSLFVDTLPNILNVYFPDHKSQDLLTKFDLAGLAVSAGSACRSRAVESSYVIEALGFSKDHAKRSIRFSFGRPTTKEEVDEALEIIGRCL